MWEPSLQKKHPISQKYLLIYVAAGDFGEGAWHHGFRKLWSGLRPAIWTGRLSCRVRGETPFLHPNLNIWSLTYQHTLHSRRLLYHMWLKQMLVCVCYLCTISEGARRALASSSIYPFPKETSFESLCSILMFRILISTISFLNKHLIFGPLYICERLYVYVIFSKGCNAQFVYSMANHLLSRFKSAQAVAPGTQFPGTEIKNRQHTNRWFLCSRRKTVFSIGYWCISITYYLQGLCNNSQEWN